MKKTRITIRLDEDIIQHLKMKYKNEGYQTALNRLLRKWLFEATEEKQEPSNKW